MAGYLRPPVVGAPLPVSGEKTPCTELSCSRGPESVGQSPGPGRSPERANGMLLGSEHQVRIHLKRLRADLVKDLLTAKVYFPIGSPPPESLKNSEFESGSNKQEDYLARLFGKYPPHTMLSGCSRTSRARPCHPQKPSSCCSDGRKVLCMEATLSSLGVRDPRNYQKHRRSASGKDSGPHRGSMWWQQATHGRY